MFRKKNFYLTVLFVVLMIGGVFLMLYFDSANSVICHNNDIVGYTKNAVYTAYDSTQKATENVSAENIVFYRNGKVFYKKPFVSVNLGLENNWKIISEMAESDESIANVRFFRGVNVSKYKNGQSHKDISLKSDNLFVNVSEQKAETEGSVDIRSPDGYVSGRGMKMDLINGSFNIKSSVKACYSDCS